MPRPPVLIAGAGPTGLVLAIALARRGTSLRVIDAAEGPGEHSRAMVVHARTLEFYRQFGFGDAVFASGVPLHAVRLREGGHDGRGAQVTELEFEELGASLSPYPTALAYPQDDHQRFLLDRLSALGVEVEWRTRLTGFTQDANGVRAELERDGRGETVEASYIAGCDGAHSQVRHNLGVGFPGGSYDQLFYVADVEIAEGFDRDLVFNLGARTLVLMLPVRSRGVQRLIGLAPPELSSRDDLGFDDVRAEAEALIGVHVSRVNWFSTYRVHHRVAASFRVGRAFMLGDAGHVHSPAGGQGMNTGIGDAVNLGWKLAQVLAGRAPDALLDSYESERLAFARWLVDTTDRAFANIVDPGVRGELARRVLAPLAIGVGGRIAPARHATFKLVSQLWVHYADSPLSEGAAGDVKGGDRLPWTGAEGATDNFAPLTSLAWQLHIHGEPDRALTELAAKLALPLHAFAWSDAARRAGFARDAAYLVRPDGYVALAAERDQAASIERYVSEQGLRFHTPA